MADFDSERTMVCHYEVMQLSMSCKADEIKKQYKVLALQYHPDRNHGNEEEATFKFKQLSAAYAVLSDPHERTWYDEHRDAILRGGNGTVGDEVDGPDLMNVWYFFNSSCYSGHDDESPTGFYQVYGDAFDEIYEREPDKTVSMKFGKSTTPISEVLRFYAEWENFASTLHFAWADLYHTVEAPNRGARRVMEKENSKARDTARKEYTNQIRSLARFVKKCDPRYVNYEIESKRRQVEQEELKKTLKTEALQERRKRREQQMQEYENDVEWQESRDNERKAAFLLADNDDGKEVRDSGTGKGDEDAEPEVSQVQKSLRKVSLDDTHPPKEGDSGEGDDGAGGDGAYMCELCARSFASDAQLAHHNTSRQHRKKVQDEVKAAKVAKKAHKDKGSAKSVAAAVVTQDA